MEPSSVLISTVADSSTGGIGSIIALIILVIIPFIVKFWNWSKETSAQGVLYQQLSDLVQKQREELDKLYTSRNTLQEQMYELKHKVDELSSCEATVEMLKKKLDEKDRIIAERDTRITKLLEDLMQMKDRVHNLEIRLHADEAKFCEGRSFKNGTQPAPVIVGVTP